MALRSGVAEEARTRGFAAPAFAECAFVEVSSYRRDRYRGCQATSPRGSVGGFLGVMCGLASNAPRESDPLEIEGEPFVTTPGDHAVELPRESETLAASEVT